MDNFGLLLPKDLRKIVEEYLTDPLFNIKLEYEQRILAGIEINYKLYGEYVLCYSFPKSSESRSPIVLSDKKEDFAAFIWNFKVIS
jgi:hypothetical protein